MNENVKVSLIISLVAHGVLFLVLFLIHLPSILHPEFVEVTFGVQSSEVEGEGRRTAGSALASRSDRVTLENTSQTVVSLPKREMPDLSNEVFPSVKAEKMGEIPAIKSDKIQTNPQNEIVKNNPSQGVVGGEGTKPLPNSGGGASFGDGTGTGASKGVQYSLDWGGAGSRSKVSGNLPKYPEGSSVSGQIKLQVIVAPDGSVSSVLPIQKVNPALEQVAINEVRLWKFEPLDKRYPQVDQPCVITFYFLSR